MLQDEEAEEFRVAQLHGDVPRERHNQKQENAGNPERVPNKFPFAFQGGK
jgi:hypothetical protein